MSARPATVLGPPRGSTDSSSAYSRVVSDSTMPVDGHAPRPHVEVEIADRELLGRRCLVGAPAEGAQAGEQFAEVERLGQVVVGAGIEPSDAGFDVVHRGEHQNRHRRTGLTDLPADHQPIAQRQHHVEDDGVVVVNAGLVARGNTVADDVDGVRLLAQPFGDHPRRVRLVFDEEYSHVSSGTRVSVPLSTFYGALRSRASLCGLAAARSRHPHPSDRDATASRHWIDGKVLAAVAADNCPSRSHAER